MGWHELGKKQREESSRECELKVRMLLGQKELAGGRQRKGQSSRSSEVGSAVWIASGDLVVCQIP